MEDYTIGFFGGCQLRVLAYYYNLIDKNNDAKWMDINKECALTYPKLDYSNENLDLIKDAVCLSYAKYKHVRDDFTLNPKNMFLWDIEAIKNYIQKCDIIIYQDPIPEYQDEGLLQITSDEMKALKKSECKLLKLTRIHHPIPNDRGQVVFSSDEINPSYNLSTLKTNKTSGDIDPSDIIYKKALELKIRTSKELHALQHSSYINLEIVREICGKLNLPWFDTDTYDNIEAVRTWVEPPFQKFDLTNR